MADSKLPPVGTFCWTELATRDATKAKKFYTELIGWKAVDQQVAGMNYTMLYPPGEDDPIGGIMQMDGEEWQGVPPHWMPYILVKNVDTSVQHSTQLGGKVFVPPTNIPNIGRFSIIEDPTGAKISLFQSL